MRARGSIGSRSCRGNRRAAGARRSSLGQIEALGCCATRDARRRKSRARPTEPRLREPMDLLSQS